MITENLSTLKIHKLTQAQYDRELANGSLDEMAIYLTPYDPPIPDNTLTKDGIAADAKAVGDAVNNLNTEVANSITETKSYINEQVRKVAPHNLLDNSDFRNPINQREMHEYTPSAISYFIDRWEVYGKGTLFSLDNQMLKCVNDGSATCGLMQIVLANKLKVGKTYTLAAKAKVTGSFFLSYGINSTTNTGKSDALEQNVDKVHVYSFTLPKSDEDTYNFRIRATAAASTAEIEWMALYEGEYTEETIPEYQSKGYGVELLECQRYYQFYKVFDTTGFVTGSAKNYYMHIQLYTPMRIKPSVCGGGWYARTAVGGYSNASSSESIAFTDLSTYGYTTNVGCTMVSLIDSYETSPGDTNNSMLTYRISNLELNAEL